MTKDLLQTVHEFKLNKLKNVCEDTLTECLQTSN